MCRTTFEASLESAKSFCNAREEWSEGKVSGVSIYDDFAHRQYECQRFKKINRGKNQLFAIIEPSSNSMRMGLHKNKPSATKAADKVGIYCNNQLQWKPEDYFDEKKFIGCWNSASKIAKFLAANCEVETMYL